MFILTFATIDKLDQGTPLDTMKNEEMEKNQQTQIRQQFIKKKQ